MEQWYGTVPAVSNVWVKGLAIGDDANESSSATTVRAGGVRVQGRP
jgi:hypothetical protein